MQFSSLNQLKEDIMDLQKIKQELEDKLAELKARTEAVESRLRQPAETDWEENAVTVKDDEVLERIEQATLAELHEVQLALNRIDAGTYGVCMTCGKKISPDRLEALPFATQCIDCAGHV